MPLRSVLPLRGPGELPAVLVSVLVVLAVLLGPVLTVTAGPAAAAGAPDAPRVVATDVLVVWDGRRETYAVRWHLSAPVREVRWLVATPGAARPSAVGDAAFARLADVAAPRHRWVVTHPWLLFSADGASAGTNLDAVRRAAAGGPVTTSVITGTDAAGTRVAAAAGAPVATVRGWAQDAARRGWRTQAVVVTAASPTTVVGPVAVDFAAGTAVVPSSAAPDGGTVRMLAVAPRVLAPEQPDVAVSRSSVPTLTVDNARPLPGTDPLLAGRATSSGGWVVTALSGRGTGVPTALVPQPGPLTDWSTQVGVWWPGWASAALAVVVVVAGAFLVTVVRRRRARRAVAVPAPRGPAGPPGAVATTGAPGTVQLDLRDGDPADTLTDLDLGHLADLAGHEPDPADTRPDIRPVG